MEKEKAYILIQMVLSMAFLENHDVDIHAKIFVRITKEINGEMKTKKIETSVGRIILNQGIYKI